MADANFINVPVENFNEATRRLQGASSILAAFSVFSGEDDVADELPITNKLLADALHGVNILLEDAQKFMSVGE